MTSLDDSLARLRADLLDATRADLRRSRRRRRLTRMAVVPASLLALSGTALALGPLSSEPAPPGVQQQFGRDRAEVFDPGVPGPGTRLFEVAREDDHVLYAGDGNEGWCAAMGTRAGAERRTDGFTCVSADHPRRGEIALIRAGGGSERWGHVAAGRVGADAVWIDIFLTTGESVTGRVSPNGYFVVSLPDSVLTPSPLPLPKPGEIDRAPVAAAAARDADGRVVARYDEGK